jgi:hypothetical protein
MEWIQTIVGIISILGGMFGLIKFMLKDIRKDIELHEKRFELHEKRFDQHEKTFESFEKKWEELSRESKLMNMRLDGLYNILINKAYGLTEKEEK